MTRSQLATRGWMFTGQLLVPKCPLRAFLIWPASHLAVISNEFALIMSDKFEVIKEESVLRSRQKHDNLQNHLFLTGCYMSTIYSAWRFNFSFSEFWKWFKVKSTYDLTHQTFHVQCVQLVVSQSTMISVAKNEQHMLPRIQQRWTSALVIRTESRLLSFVVVTG